LTRIPVRRVSVVPRCSFRGRSAFVRDNSDIQGANSGAHCFHGVRRCGPVQAVWLDLTRCQAHRQHTEARKCALLRDAF